MWAPTTSPSTTIAASTSASAAATSSARPAGPNPRRRCALKPLALSTTRCATSILGTAAPARRRRGWRARRGRPRTTPVKTHPTTVKPWLRRGAAPRIPVGAAARAQAAAETRAQSAPVGPSGASARPTPTSCARPARARAGCARAPAPRRREAGVVPAQRAEGTSPGTRPWTPGMRP
eukprot:scaffold12267_cov120-Isochrysis_galbana.AAC.1